MAYASDRLQAANELELANQSNQQVESVLRDLDGALKYLCDGANTHPNRLDICEATSHPNKQGSATPFSQQSAFGQPSSNNHPSTFGTSPSVSASFGQPNALDSTYPQQQQQQQQHKPSFGQPAQLDQGVPFGSTPTPSTFSEQHTPSPFGLVPRGVNVPQFGQSQVSAGLLAFNQTHQQTQQLSSFGLPPGTTSGQQQQVLNAPASGQPTNSRFAQPGLSPFGQLGTPSADNAINNQAFPTNQPFGQPIGVPNSSFAPQQPAAVMPNTGFGQPQFPLAAAHSSLGQPPSSGTFGSGQQNSQSMTSTTKGDGTIVSQPMSNGAIVHTIQSLAPAEVRSYTTRDASNKLLTWQGQPVTYNQEGEPCFRSARGVERIWFPDGPPTASANNEDTNLQYSNDLKEAYGFLSHNGTFKDGIMPEVAPRIEWCRWDI